MEQLIIEDISLDESQARVTVNAVPDIPGLAAQVFDEVAQSGVVVDMIVQNVGREGRTNISFTMPQRDLEKSLRVIREQAEGLGCPPPDSSPRVAKLSVFGVGMKSHTSVASRLFAALAERRDQRRVDQHDRGPRERDRGRRPRRERPGGAVEGVRRRDGVCPPPPAGCLICISDVKLQCGHYADCLPCHEKGRRWLPVA